MLGVSRQPKQAEAAEFWPKHVRETVLTVDLGGDGCDLAQGESPHSFAQSSNVIAQVKIQFWLFIGASFRSAIIAPTLDEWILPFARGSRSSQIGHGVSQTGHAFDCGFELIESNVAQSARWRGRFQHWARGVLPGLRMGLHSRHPQ